MFLQEFGFLISEPESLQAQCKNVDLKDTEELIMDVDNGTGFNKWEE